MCTNLNDRLAAHTDYHITLVLELGEKAPDYCQILIESGVGRHSE